MCPQDFVSLYQHHHVRALEHSQLLASYTAQKSQGTPFILKRLWQVVTPLSTCPSTPALSVVSELYF
jgi:hypothetical protein